VLTVHIVCLTEHRMKALETVHVILNSCTLGRNFCRLDLAKWVSLY